MLLSEQIPLVVSANSINTDIADLCNKREQLHACYLIICLNFWYQFEPLMKILVDKQLYRPGSVVKGIVLLDYISRPYNAKYIRLNATGISKVRLAPSPLQVHIKHLHIAHFIPFTTRGLRIPNTIVPSGSTLPIDVQYSIKVSMFASSTAKNATVMIPITIGSQTAPVYPEEDSTVAVNSSFPSTTSLNPSLYLPTSSTYPATSRSPHLSPSTCLLYTSPSPRDATLSRMPSSA